MRLSNQYRVLFWRQAALTDAQILDVYKRYDYLDNPKEELAQFKEIQDTLSAYTTKTDLLAEWVVKSMSSGAGDYPDDMPRFILAIQFYSGIYDTTGEPSVRLQKIQKFQQVVQRLSQEEEHKFNSKNILEFTLYDLEKLQDYYNEKPVDPRVNRLEGALPEGASMFYNDGTYQIVEITSGDAACHFGQGTRWCTKMKETAEDDYLSKAPLYVLFVKGKKYRQLHIVGEDSQFMNLQNEPMEIEEPVREVLVKTGLLQRLLTQVSSRMDWHNHEEQEEDALDAPSFWERWVGRKRIPELEDVIKASPQLSYAYVVYNIGHRAPEFEDSISKDATVSYWYAKKIIGGRFIEGEPAIMRTSFIHGYSNFLNMLHIKQLKPFLDDYSDNRRLDEYRFLVFKSTIQIGATVYRKTAHMKYVPSLNGIALQYEYWHGPKPENNYIWLDDSGEPVHELNQ